MKDEESQTGAESAVNNNGYSGGAVTGNGKGRYKVWAIAGIIVLALWSLFTGSVSLKWSALNPISDDFKFPVSTDLDILELEEREKLVNQLWNVYTNSKTVKLPKFWLDAFKAAYEELVSDIRDVRNGAISEIAKLSVRSNALESPPVQSKNTREFVKRISPNRLSNKR